MNYSFSKKRKNMLAIVAIAISNVVMAQNRVFEGTLVDSVTKESISGAVITIGDHKVCSDIDGRFSLPIEGRQKTITFDYIGYKTMSIDVSTIRNLGIVEMTMDTDVLPDAIITSQMAVPRKTPVSVSNVLSFQIEERLGNDEFVEVLKYFSTFEAKSSIKFFCSSFLTSG